jgi:translation initiation factor IF-2
MRVYELAKKIGMENRDLIPELKRLGINVASHSSALDEETVRRVLEILMPGADQAKKKADGKQESEAARHAKRDGGRTPASKSPVLPVEEAPKSDKKRILFKRKKTDESPAGMEPSAESGVGLETPVRDVHGAAPSHLQAPPQPAGVGERPAGEVSLETAMPHRQEPLDSPVGTAAAPAAPPASAVVAPAPGLPASTEEERRGEKRKPAGPEVLPDAAGLKERLKKVKKTGRAWEEEGYKFREDAARWQDLRAIPVHRREDRSRHAQPSASVEVTKPRKKLLKLTAGLTVKEFAELVGQRPADIIKKLMELGQVLTLNQPMNLDTASLIAESLGVKADVTVEKQGEELLEEAALADEKERLEPRPPVVTIMGHVDHGKTSLLDAIRQTRVTEQEAGGITQHIGAYTVPIHGKRVTFLDTPGHEAFTAMRARGAKVTDIVILVVAADDGVMPQTIEAINHATAANVPMIVAVNKIDKPGANPERVKNILSEHGLIPESWGGQTIFVEVSAKQKVGLDHLLEMILLQAEVLELKTDPYRMARGTVIEAKLDRGRGPVATVLVQSGTLRVGDIYVVGSFSGRVRALVTDTGAKVPEAGPSMPVEVIGLPGVPSAGDSFVVVSDERVAREIAEARQQKQRIAELAAGAGRVTLDDLYAKIKEGDVKELAVVIKADVQGSAEALSEAVEKLSTPAVKLQVIHKGVGGITETDVLLASASRAIIIGFNVRPESKASTLAERDGIDIRLYTIIYDAIADIRAAMEGLLEPTLKERALGRAEVRQVFNIPKAGTVAGCYVLEGTISRASTGVRVIRDHVAVYEGKLSSLRRFKDDVREVQQGYECGIGVENFNDLKPGDVIEAYVIDKVAVKL